MQQNFEDWNKIFNDFLELVELTYKEIEDDIDNSSNTALVGPLIYNFKHSLELFLKSWIIYLNGGILVKEHDIKKLLGYFLVGGKIKLKKSLRKELKKIVDRYYNLGQIDIALSTIDFQNTVMKYPDSKNVDYFSFWYGLNIEKKQEIIFNIREDSEKIFSINCELRSNIF